MRSRRFPGPGGSANGYSEIARALRELSPEGFGPQDVAPARNRSSEAMRAVHEPPYAHLARFLLVRGSWDANGEKSRKLCGADEMLLLLRQRSHAESSFLDDGEVASPIVPAFQDGDGRLSYMGGGGHLDTK